MDGICDMVLEVGSAQGADRRLVLDSYGRLSRVPETGELEKIETQWADNRTVISRVGATLGAELKDGLSAWKRRVRRPGWERLLERVKSGASDGIVVWHTDRLFRQPRDLETLIDLAERGFKIYSVHGARDLANPDDRFILRIEVAHAARSSDDTSRRIKRRFATFRESGRGHVGGARRFGHPGRDLTWTPGVGETEQDRPMVSAGLVERERQAIRDAADALLMGVGQGTITTEWNRRGLLTAAGRGWVVSSFRPMMLRPTNAGLIMHDGKLVGRMDGEPIVDEDTFRRVQALYQARRRGRTVGERYIGTGILRCGLCGTTLSAHPGTDIYKDTGEKRRSYFCNKQRRGCGKVNADARAVDRELLAFTIDRLSNPQHAEAVAAATTRVSERLAVVEAEIAQRVAIQQGLSARLGRLEIELDAFDHANSPLVTDLARLRAERDSLLAGYTTSGGGSVRVQTPKEIETQWDKGTIAQQRVLLTQALGRSTLVIDPFRHTGKRVFDRERVRRQDPPAPPTPDTAPEPQPRVSRAA